MAVNNFKAGLCGVKKEYKRVMILFFTNDNSIVVLATVPISRLPAGFFFVQTTFFSANHLVEPRIIINLDT